MWKRRFLLCVALLGLIDGAESQIEPADEVGHPPLILLPEDPSVPVEEKKCNYNVFISPVLKSGKTAVVCANIQCEESVVLTIVFAHQYVSDPVFTESIPAETTFFECRKISVPEVNSTQLAYLTISIKGKTENINIRKEVVIDLMPTAYIYQTQKNMFEPGDTVIFRLIYIDNELKPLKPNCAVIYFVDPNGARIAQIEKPDAEYYVISGEFPISEDASLGTYRIDCVKDDGGVESKYFQVQKYTLPRFESTVSCPSSLSVLDKTAKIEIKAKYVYGKPLTGTAIIVCTRGLAYLSPRATNCLRDLKEITKEFTVELVNGTHTAIMDLDTFSLPVSEYDSNIQCTFTIKETGTGVLDTKYCYIGISKRPANVQLERFNPNYRHGLPLRLEARLTNEKGEPIPNKNLTITVEGVQIKKVVTDAEGRIRCEIDTTPYHKSNLTIQVCYTDDDQCYTSDQRPPRIYDGYSFAPNYPYYPYYPYYPDYPCDQTVVYRTYSQSGSFVQIRKLSEELQCYESYKIDVDYIFKVATGQESVSVYYLVKSSEDIVAYGQQTVDLTSSTDGKGTYSIELSINSTYDDSAQIIIYSPMEKDMISDTWQFSVKPCTENEVSANFTQSVVLPGSVVEQVITAAPGSLCFLRCWDKSLELISSFNDFTTSYVRGQTRYYQFGYHVKDFDLSDQKPPCKDPNKEVFCNGGYYLPYSTWTDGDTSQDFESASIIVITNLQKNSPQVCGMEQDNTQGPIHYKSFAAFDSVGFGSGGEAAPAAIETLRIVFEDTFFVESTIIGPDGKGNASAKIPDTITEWHGDTFCISKKAGLGITDEYAKVTTYLDFFLEMTGPGYCTRGEKVLIVITVVNYEDNCKDTAVVVEPSEEYEMKLVNVVGSTCICKGQRVSVRYSMTLLKFGDIKITVSAVTTKISKSCDGDNDNSIPPRKDTVEKIMKVTAEGIQREDTQSTAKLVNGSLSETYTLEMPDDVVDGTSERSLTVVGEPMGLMTTHLRNLLTQPAGCCEQKLAQIIPLIFLRSYLKSAGMINDDIDKEAKSIICAGYSRLLSCRRWDGTCTSFPNSDTANSWVLVKMFSAFDMMKEDCFVDDNIQQVSLKQLGSLQNVTSGSLNPSGPILTSSDERHMDTIFTAYVGIHLKQAKNLYGIGVIILQGIERYLKSVDVESMPTYAVAYIFHATARLQIPDIWNRALVVLTKSAIEIDGRRFWTEDNLPPTNAYVSSLVSDATANILMGFLHGPVSEQDTNYMGPIVLALTSFMNSKGGFISSQDTMPATQAMTEYAERFSVKNPNCEVIASQGEAELARISVNEANKYLVQSKRLPVSSGQVTITINGECAALVQLTHNYNIKVKSDSSSFSLRVTTRTESCTSGVAPIIYSDFSIQYTGQRNRTNMVYMYMKGLTGYSLDIAILYQLKYANKIANFGIEDNFVYIYWEYMDSSVDYSFTLTSYMDNRVYFLAESTVVIADYYNIAESAGAVFSTPCSPLTVEE